MRMRIPPLKIGVLSPDCYYRKKASAVHGSKRFRAHRIITASAAGLTALSTALVAPSASADEVQELMAELDTVSRDASAKNEEVKELEDRVAIAEQDLVHLEGLADSAAQKAETARSQQERYQQQIDGLAGVKYRVDNLDPVTNALSAQNPQNMIDRSAYLGTLARGTTSELEEIEKQMRAAAAEASRAHAAVAEAEFHRSMLAVQQAQLETERAELAEDVAALEERIDSLDAEQREAWVNQNNPAEPASLSGIDATGAVGAALSKIGSPYGWGATGPSAFDCSGLMYWAYQQLGQTIPRTSQAQLAGGTPVSLDQLQPGDIIGYYPGTTHVGMYIGNGQIVHASDYGIPVQIVPYDSMPITGASRY